MVKIQTEVEGYRGEGIHRNWMSTTAISISVIRVQTVLQTAAGSAISVSDRCLAYDSNDDECDSGSETEVIEEEASANEDTSPIVNIFELLQNAILTDLDGNNNDAGQFTNQNTRTKI